LARTLFAAALLVFTASARAVSDDSYLAGYATAVVERDLGLKVVSLEVRDRVAHVVVEDLGDQPAERISEALTRIEGIERVGVSAQLRLYHQSSHLGDEFPLRSSQNRANRVNLSYEGIDLLVSYDPRPWLRLYAGAGELLHTEPQLDRLSAHGGVELRSPMAFFGGAVRPIAAFDYQSREENHRCEELAGSAGI